jgi:8-oxo-dGTP diphosphatase
MIICHFEKSKQPAYLRHVVVDMLVVDKGKILLVKRAGKYLEPNKWALPGGFVQRDETTAQAAMREIKEETGYQTKIIGLFRLIDTPHRPKEDRQNVSFVYLLQPLKKVGGSDHEIDRIKWFDLDRLPPRNQIAFDHFDNLKLYRRHLKKPFNLPLLK